VPGEHVQQRGEVRLPPLRQERVEVLDEEERALEAGLPIEQVDQGGEGLAVVGRQLSPAHHQLRAADPLAARLDQRPLAHAVGPLQVEDEPVVVAQQRHQPLGELGREHQVVPAGRRHDHPGQGLQPFVELVVVEEEPGDPGVEHDGLAQQRAGRRIDRVHQLDEVVAAQRPFTTEAAAGRHLGLHVGAQQVEDQADRGLPQGHAVVQFVQVRVQDGVQLGVPPPVATVDLGREADQDDVDVERGEVEQLGQHHQAQRHTVAHGGQHALADLRRRRPPDARRSARWLR
jgi:hypothetical protein